MIPRTAHAAACGLAALALLNLGCDDILKRVTTVPVYDPSRTPGVDVADLQARYPGQGAVCLEWKTDYEHLAGPKYNYVWTPGDVRWNWKTYETLRQTWAILDPQDPASRFALDVPAGIDLEQVVLWTQAPDGRRASFGLQDLTVERHGDGETSYKFAYPDVRPGTLVGSAFSLCMAKVRAGLPIYYNLDVQFREPVRKLEVRYIYPADWQVRVKDLGPGVSLPVQTAPAPGGKVNILSYQAEDVPGLPDEPFSPFRRETGKYLQLQVSKLRMITNADIFDYEMARDWKGLGRKIREWAVDREALGGAVAAAAREITAGCDTDYQKVDAVVDWLQTRMTVVDSEWGNFYDYLVQRKGSTEQITGLARSLLRQVGVEAEYLLVHPADRGWFDPEYRSHQEFSAPALLVRLDGVEQPVFPARRGVPVGHVPERFQGQPALVLGGPRDATVVQLPAGSQGRSALEASYEVTLQEDGRAKVVETLVGEGSQAYDLRRALAGRTEAEAAKLVRERGAFGGARTVPGDYLCENRLDYRKPLRITCSYTVEDLVRVTPDEAVLAAGSLRVPAAGLGQRLPAGGRVNPIRIYFDTTLGQHFVLRTPAHWSLATPLPAVKVENRFGSVTRTAEAGPGQVGIDQTLALRPSQEPPEHYPELLALAGPKPAGAVPGLVFRVGRPKA